MARGSSPIYRGRVSNYVPKRVEDSPSRQLQYELERTFAQIQLQETERQKLYIFERKQVQDELNAKEFAQAAAHRAELDQAIAKHEAVRQQALAVLHAHIKEEEEKQRRKEEEARRRREEEERRKAEQERKAREEQERKIREERERQEAQKRAEAEKARIAQERERERQEREAAARREREQQEETKRQAEAEAVRQKQEADRAASLKATTSTASAPSTAISQDHDPYTSNPEIRHKHYLNIHQSLKKFRTEFWARVKKEPQLKKFVGDARRDLKVAVGQLSLDDKNINKLAVSISTANYMAKLTLADRKSQDMADESTERSSVAACTSEQLSATTSRLAGQEHYNNTCRISISGLYIQQSNHQQLRQ